MEVHGELWGQKRFSFKPPLVMPTIAKSRRVMALGHIEEGAMERSCAKGQKRSYWSQKKICMASRRGIDSKKLWAQPGTFMYVRPHPDTDEGS